MGDPFRGSKALTISGFSCLAHDLNSIVWYVRRTTGQRATPPKSLAATRAKEPSPKAVLGGWHPPRISSERKAGD